MRLILVGLAVTVTLLGQGGYTPPPSGGGGGSNPSCSGGIPVWTGSMWNSACISSTAPTFTTSVTSPSIYGGTAAGSALTLASTSNGSPSGDVVNLNGSTVNIGSGSPASYSSGRFQVPNTAGDGYYLSSSPFGLFTATNGIGGLTGFYGAAGSSGLWFGNAGTGYTIAIGRNQGAGFSALTSTLDITDQNPSTGATRVNIGLGPADSSSTTILTIGGATSIGSLSGSGTTPICANNSGVLANCANSFSTLTDGATVTWATASAPFSNASLTFTVHSGSRTLNLTGLVNGGNYVLRLQQDSTGGEGLTLGTGCTWKVSGGGGGAITPSTAANAIDVLAFTYDGTNCYANFNKNFN